MATNSSTGLRPFDKDQLEYVKRALSTKAINPVVSLRHVIRCEYHGMWEDITSWIGGFQPYKRLCPGKGLAGAATSSLWDRAKDTEFMINGLAPIFIFLTVPGHMDLREAWRSILCTLICEISDFITHVPSDKMSKSGVYGGESVWKYFVDSQTHDDVDALIELLYALQHCEYETGHQGVKYVYVVVIDRIKRFWEGDRSHYWKAFKAALAGLVGKMGAYVLFIDEPERSANVLTH